MDSFHARESFHLERREGFDRFVGVYGLKICMEKAIQCFSTAEDKVAIAFMDMATP